MSTNRAARAGLQTLLGTGTQMAIQLINLTVLARLLPASTFGVYAMAMTVIGFTALFRDMGLSSAAVQAKTLSHETRSNLWWINTAIGGGLALITVAGSPLAARFFREPDVALVMVLMAPTLLLAGATAQYSASLARDMRFGVIAATNVIGGVIGLIVSIVIAANGGGVWALAVPQVVSGVISFAILSIAAGWLPARPRRGHGTRRMLTFGVALFGTQILTYAHRNLDVALLGRLHGTEITGQFNRAAQLSRTPLSMLSGPFASVSLATMAPHQDDHHALANLTHKGQVLLGLPILSAAAMLVASAEWLVPIVLGPGWDVAVPFVQLIATAEAMALMGGVGGWIIIARGLAGKLVRLSLISAVLKISAMLVGTLWGPYGIIAGAAASQLVLWPLSLLLAGRMADVPARRLLSHSYLLILVMGIATAVGWASGTWASGWSGDIGGVVAAGLGLAAALGVTAVLVPAFRRDVKTFASTVRSGIR